MVTPNEGAPILVVDDREENLVALRAILSHFGDEVVCVRSGREALKRLLDQEFAVILLDVNMPELDGFATASLIRGRERTRDVPILFLTASDHELHRVQGYALGAVDYILTPVQAEILRSKVGVFVDLARKTQQVRRQAASLQRKAAQLQKLANASLAISGARSLEGMLREITRAARDVIGTHAALTATVLPSARKPPDRLRAYVSFSERHAESAHDPALVARVAASVVMTNSASTRLGPSDLADASKSLDLGPEEQLRLAPWKGLLGAPLTDADDVRIGTLAVSDKIEGDFTEDDEAILIQLAQLAAITVQNWCHEDAREANRIKDEFLGTLSHELRTPLHAILGWTEQLRAAATQEELTHAVEVIERNVQAQARLVEDLLDVSRINSGKLHVEVRRISLDRIVLEALDAHRPVAEAKAIALTTSLDAGGLEVLGDPDRLRQLVSNLLSNALKFTPSGGNVAVTTRRTADGVHEVRVSDTGIGIDPDFLPFVFERFRQGDSSSRRAHSGLGLGLAIVRHIAELHGGGVEVESPGPGGGTTFRVRLPLKCSPRAANASSPTIEIDPEELPLLEGIRVLVVDDDADAREMLERVLRRRRAEVVAVGSVQEALLVLAAERPHVLISDLAMPGQDGLDLIRLIRERSADDNGDVPALALTASAGDEFHDRAIDAGFQLYAAKPMRPAALVDAVRQLASERSGVAVGAIR